MNQLFKNIFIAVAFLLITGALVSYFFSPFQEMRAITLGELADKINQDAIARVMVDQNLLTIEMKDGEKVESRKEGETSLIQTLRNLGVSEEKLRSVPIVVNEESGLLFWVGNILPFLFPFIIIFLFLWMLFRQAQRGTMQAFSFTKSQIRMVSPLEKNRVTFHDVAGLHEAKEELQEIVEFLKRPKKFLDMGANIPRGVLLVGPAGAGKTLLARATAGEANVPFFHISGSEFIELFVGVGASRVRDAFRLAKKQAPSLLFVDEIDAVGRIRGAGLGGGHDEREQTLNQILVEMDGFERETGVLVMAATNRPDILDSALLRPGRFDRKITLDLPDINEREAILTVHGKGKPLAKDVRIREVAERTPGFSGADLANVMNEGALLAARRNKHEINQIDLREAIDKVLLGPERKSHMMSPHEKKITAYHEAGHALVATMLPHLDSVHKISIVARGHTGGYTLKLPTEDRRLRTRAEFITDLATALGGYVAEKTVFGDITTGAADDLKKATDLARRLVTQFGMSDKLGPATWGEREEMVFLGKEVGIEKTYSEKVAAKIDEEVTRLIENARRQAEDVIKKRRPLLEDIAVALLEKETLERDEFEAIINGAPEKDRERDKEKEKERPQRVPVKIGAAVKERSLDIKPATST
ncbi:MAG: ATP-dependent zinc metalloprotease FtsH [bacterium]|nr:ATP-dependent zinc metalloprotease FtsH [bacterium]MDZ4296249.1 ATP-dependent zinc metalloprotease FtsH [Patescibacteria group bacterium]